jgi:hypothetical protein
MKTAIPFQESAWNSDEKKLLQNIGVWSKIVEEMQQPRRLCCLYTGNNITLLESFMWTTSIYGYDFWHAIDNALDTLKGY